AHEGLIARAREVCAALPEACPAGVPDRRKLAERVFRDEEARRRLEAILHPYVRARFEEALSRLEAEGAPLAVLEIPLLFETGWEKRLDGVLVVTAPAALRYRRLRARGISEEEARRREAAQLPEAEKRRRADWVIENAGDLSELKAKVLRWLKEVDP
ncbi:MAG TPA: dephospho-CoA kinase, partial [Oceanithermus sp.]|nr:dephospho-CoA kinase [Oceanithermus sp.]